jgi:hypothetical protein
MWLFYDVPVDFILDIWVQVYPFQSLDCIKHYLKEGREQEKRSGASKTRCGEKGSFLKSWAASIADYMYCCVFRPS